jgi:hypothetical protein
MSAIHDLLRDFFDRMDAPERKAFFDAYVDNTSKFILTAIKLTTPQQKAACAAAHAGLDQRFQRAGAGEMRASCMDIVPPCKRSPHTNLPTPAVPARRSKSASSAAPGNAPRCRCSTPSACAPRPTACARPCSTGSTTRSTATGQPRLPRPVRRQRRPRLRGGQPRRALGHDDRYARPGGAPAGNDQGQAQGRQRQILRADALAVRATWPSAASAST